MAAKESLTTNGIKAVGIESVSATLNDRGNSGDGTNSKGHWNFVNWRNLFPSSVKKSKKTKVGPKVTFHRFFVIR